MENDAVREAATGVPLSLRVSVTDRCRFRCVFCTPAEGVKRFRFAEILRYEEIARFVALLMAHFRLAKVHLTGGEPLDRPEVVKLVRMLAGLGVEDLALTTNGQRLREFAGDLKGAGLRRVNVSLNTLQAETFRGLTGGGELQRTLDGLEAALSAGLAPVKCNATVLRGINDGEVVDLVRFGAARGVETRFIELMPIGPAAKRHADWFVSSDEVLERLRGRFDLRPLPRRRGSSTQEYEVADAGGNTGLVGVISSYTRPFCGDCRRLRLTASGQLVGCLARDSRVDVLPLLRAAGPLDEAALLAKVRAVMRLKRTHHAFSNAQSMVQTGG